MRALYINSPFWPQPDAPDKDDTDKCPYKHTDGKLATPTVHLKKKRKEDHSHEDVMRVKLLFSKKNTPFHTFWFKQPFIEGYPANKPPYLLSLPSSSAERGNKNQTLLKE